MKWSVDKPMDQHDHEIAFARHEDFAAIAALDRIAWLHTGEAFIADGEHVWRVWCEYASVLVARDSSRPALPITGALVMFPTTTNELFLHKIMVHPDYRARGIGTRLMETALAQADRPVLLTVDPANQTAVHLYERFGFGVRDQVQDYYGPGIDRYVMVFHRVVP